MNCNNDLSLDTLASPEVCCPSPVVIFKTSGQKSNVPIQAFKTPHPIQTPIVNNNHSKEDVAAALQLIKEIQDQITQRFQQFDRKANIPQPVYQLARKPTMLHCGFDDMCVSNVNMIDSVSMIQSDCFEKDSLFMSTKDLEQLVDQTVEKEITTMSHSIQQSISTEQTLKRLEQNVQLIMQTQARSVWFK
ncbi:Hypothetical_protein [Hexamita inflata]|uniref:Hypothetical_protein n=1 Tax=Hexamita inflata TaxID=28002 RepID=A0AA86PBH8_9EUKA|nr:Hypothetical protein HINF_LOCUS23375 [Hexamita inflata]